MMNWEGHDVTTGSRKYTCSFVTVNKVIMAITRNQWICRYPLKKKYWKKTGSGISCHLSISYMHVLRESWYIQMESSQWENLNHLYFSMIWGGRWLVLLFIMVELLTITIETFLQKHLFFFVYQIQPLSKKNLKYVYKNIVWLDTRAS